MLALLCLLALILTLFFVVARNRSSRSANGLLVLATMAAVLCSVVYLSQASGGPQSQPVGGAQTPNAATMALYQRLCQRCHGEFGQGERDAGVEGLPDFTARAFHQRRSDAQLLVSILDGKGASMPSFRGKLTKEQARALAARIRAFRPHRPAETATPPMAQGAASDFGTQFQKLQQELKDLKEQTKGLTPQSEREKSPPNSTHKNEAPDAQQAPLRAAAALYCRHCQRCHNANGKGDKEISGRDSPPDFTRRAWQQERSDAQLMTTMLDGKGTAMPAFRKKLSKEDAELLVDYIRAFSPRGGAAPVRPRTPRKGEKGGSRESGFRPSDALAQVLGSH